jgi:hypothetical protein
MAIGLVLRNGEPRYIFPTIDTYLDAAGKRWRNRGIFSVPLAKTWLHYGESPADNLRLSSFVIAPTLAEGDATAAPTAAAPPEAAGDTAASKASGSTWERFGQWAWTSLRLGAITAVLAVGVALALGPSQPG